MVPEKPYSECTVRAVIDKRQLRASKTETRRESASKRESVVPLNGEGAYFILHVLSPVIAARVCAEWRDVYSSVISACQNILYP